MTGRPKRGSKVHVEFDAVVFDASHNFAYMTNGVCVKIEDCTVIPDPPKAGDIIDADSAPEPPVGTVLSKYSKILDHRYVITKLKYAWYSADEQGRPYHWPNIEGEWTVLAYGLRKDED